MIKNSLERIEKKVDLVAISTEQNIRQLEQTKVGKSEMIIYKRDFAEALDKRDDAITLLSKKLEEVNVSTNGWKLKAAWIVISGLIAILGFLLIFIFNNLIQGRVI